MKEPACMPYVLGIDLGHTHTSAAVCLRSGTHWGEAEVVVLDGGSRTVESVLYVAPDGGILVGDAARGRAHAEPERVATGFVGRVGDAVALVLGQDSYPAETVAAALAGWVVDRVADLHGGPAERIVLAHPPGWGGHRRAVLHAALEAAGLPGVLLLPNPVAAAESLQAREPQEPGAVLGVCRLGGDHAEAALVRRGQAGFDLVTHAEGADSFTGSRLDDVLAEHVLAAAGDATVPAAALAKLRLACARAKEELSAVPEVTVPLTAPGGPAEIRIGREVFDRLARPVLEAAVLTLRRLAEPVPEDELRGAVLVGGSARIPLATALAEELLGCRVFTDPDPESAICRGAALAARPRMAVEPAPTPIEAPGRSTALVPDGEPAPEPGFGAEPPPPRPPVEVTPLQPPRRFPRLRREPEREEATGRAGSTEGRTGAQAALAAEERKRVPARRPRRELENGSKHDRVNERDDDRNEVR
jgi:molecular chaperone DnaK (HSP70)